MSDRDFEIFKMAFGYVQQHRFSHVKSTVGGLHLVGPEGEIDPDFRAMLVSVFDAIRQGLRAVEESGTVS